MVDGQSQSASSASHPSSITSKMTSQQLYQQITTPIFKLYSRAPASFLTLTSLILSYLVTLSINDYKLWMSIGKGGFLPKNLSGWLIHCLMRPLGLNSKQVKDPEWLPNADENDTNLLKDLKVRSGERPEVFGVVPHRQINDLMQKDDPMKKEITEYFREIATSNPQLKCSTSLLENDTSPALFKTSTSSSSSSNQGSLSSIYLSGTHGEFCHLHQHDGSLHIILSPKDCRKLLSTKWGECHPLAGLLYRSHWLGLLRFSPFKSLRDLRFRSRPSTNDSRNRKGAAIPPTYSIVYGPRNEEEMKVFKGIVNASVAFALS